MLRAQPLDCLQRVAEIGAAVYEDDVGRSAGAGRALIAAERHLHCGRTQERRDIRSKGIVWGVEGACESGHFSCTT